MLQAYPELSIIGELLVVVVLVTVMLCDIFFSFWERYLAGPLEM